MLRAGALPAPLIIVEERSVGPGLGADSIAAGKFAAIIGMILVCVFMVLIYGSFGLIANISLVANLFIILAYGLSKPTRFSDIYRYLICSSSVIEMSMCVI